MSTRIHLRASKLHKWLALIIGAQLLIWFYLGIPSRRLNTRLIAGSGFDDDGALSLNHAIKRPISIGTLLDGGPSKCTRGAWIALDTICITSSCVR